jgi:hypothetical protein
VLLLAAVAALVYASSTTDVTDFLFSKHVPPIHEHHLARGALPRERVRSL